jgi:hypothetical protein
MKKKSPVRLLSTSCLPDRPKYETGWLKIIATLAEANAIRPHSGTSKLIVINQVGESVASVGSSEEDEYYRNDSLKYCALLVLGENTVGEAKLTVRTNSRKKGRRLSGIYT